MRGPVQPLELPKMRMLHQRLSVLPAVNVLTEIEREWAALKDRIEFPLKGSVAIAVGSRGISNLTEVVWQSPAVRRDGNTRNFLIPQGFEP